MGTSGDRLRPDQAAWFVDRLWHGLEGFAACAFGRQPHYDDKGKFGHNNWQEVQYRWPASRDRMLAEAFNVAESGGDAYVCPALMAIARRKQEDALPGRITWVDIDGELTDHQVQLVVRLVRGASFLVRSGRGVHLYVATSEVQPPHVIERANYKLKVALSGDHKHAANSLLRLPGTLNTKPMPLGGDALPVEVLMRG